MKFILLLAITLAISQAAVTNCVCSGKQGLDANKACVDTTVKDCELALGSDNTKCFRCAEGFYPNANTSATTCTAIGSDKVDDCKYYNKDKKCTMCASGKALGSDGKCGTEIKDCATHTGVSTALKCASCKLEKKLKSDKTGCDAGKEVTNCIAYDKGTPESPACSLCKEKYYLNGTECKEVGTVDKCTSFSSANGDCEKCENGYVLLSKKCEKITVDKCISGTAKDKCTVCEGFAPKDDLKACDVKVDPIDANCMGYDKDKKCYKCKSGYGADKTNKCTVKCPTSGGNGGNSNASILKALVLPIVLLVALLF